MIGFFVKTKLVFNQFYTISVRISNYTIFNIIDQRLKNNFDFDFKA